MILVDSSVWIDLLRDVQTQQTLALRELLPWREAALTVGIYQEILQGAATPERFTKLKRYFRTLTAIRLHFKWEEDVSIHTLVAAARNVLCNLCAHRGVT